MRAMVTLAAAAASLRWAAAAAVAQQQVRCCSLVATAEVQQEQRLKGLRIAMTTPQNYAGRLAEALRREGALPVACPSIQVERTPAMKQDMERIIWGVASDAKGLSSFKGIAFVSRSAIATFAEALQGKRAPLPRVGDNEDDDADGEFLVGALGQDAELVRELGLFDPEQQQNQRRVRFVVPPVATPEALVEALGEGRGRRLLCAVPQVMGLEEPAVVPNFMASLKGQGWNAIRINAYLTKWLGPDCAQPLLSAVAAPPDALVFTSTAEVEGLLKSLKERNCSLREVTMPHGSEKRCLVVAYGPVTAEGAERLGVRVDLVGHNFNSFVDLVGLLIAHFKHQFDKPTD